MSERRHERYLGDAVYVFIDESDNVWIYTSDGVTESNHIMLEPAVNMAFVRWMEALVETR